MTQRPERLATPEHIETIAVVDMVEALAERTDAMLFYTEHTGTFAQGYTTSLVSAFAAETKQAMMGANELIEQLGGIPFEFVDEVDGETVQGLVLGCNGYDPNTRKLSVALVNDKLRAISPDAYLDVGVLAGELRAGYLRAMASTDEFTA